MIGNKLYNTDLPTLLRSLQQPGKAGVAICDLILIALVAYALVSEVRRLKARIPGINGPTGLPVVGNLHQLGPDPAEQLRQWGKKYGGVFQITMGNAPVVVFKSMQAAKDVFIGQGGSLVDRPRFYTFHSVVSSVASSIGTTPW